MSASRFELHEAVPSDADAIYQIYKELFLSHIEKIWGWNEAWQRLNFDEEWKSARTWRIESEGRLAGYIQQRDEPDYVYLLSVAIIPDFQGRGLGAEIMHQFQEKAAGLGQPLRLSVFRTNPRALSFYRNLGFRVTEETPEFHRLEWLSASETEGRG